MRHGARIGNHEGVIKIDLAGVLICVFGSLAKAH
jgi:hypothetical protein